MSGIVGSRLNNRGSGLIGSLGTDGQVLTSSGAGVGAVYETASGGTTLTGSTNNTVTTVTGADAIQGETNFIYDGTIVGAGADGANADLGVGLHIKTADSGAGVLAGADELIIEGSGDNGISILTATDATSRICFGDSGGANQGIIDYAHGTDKMAFKTADTERMRIDSSGNLLVGTTSTTINVSNFGLKIASSGILSSSANVDGGSTATEHFGNAGYIRFMGDGDAENSNNSYGALSDERLKENITDANSQWNDIKELQIKNYNLIAYPDRTHIGVIAQDLEADNMSGLVQETKPEVEHIEINSNFGTIEDDTDHPILDDEGNETGIYQQKVKTVNSKVKSVKYSVLYMKAIKALQESMERIEQLEAKVEALENA